MVSFSGLTFSVSQRKRILSFILKSTGRIIQGMKQQVVSVKVPCPKGLSIEEEETMLRVCAADLMALEIPMDGLRLTSEHIVLECGEGIPET